MQTDFAHDETSCGRLHLPVAPTCNMQCKYCDRNYDCPNQARAGVSSLVLTPTQAMLFVDEVLARKKDITAIGVAGPGDALADPERAIETLRLLAEAHPGVKRFLATNGLRLAEHVPALAGLGLAYVTVAVNAVDPAIAAQVYSFIRPEKRSLFGEEGAAILIESQRAGIAALKAAGMETQAVCTVIPGLNDRHVADLAAWLAALGVDRLELIPFQPRPNSPLSRHPAATRADMLAARDAARPHIPLLDCCARCRADAVGLLGESLAAEILNRVLAAGAQNGPVIMPDAQRPCIAVATSNGETVDTHLGHAHRFLVYQNDHGLVTLKESRQAPPKGGGEERWKALAALLADCKVLIAAGAGENPKAILSQAGLAVRVVDEDADLAPLVLAAFGIKKKKAPTL